MSEVKPTFVRYQTVRNAMVREPGLAPFLLPDDVSIPHRDGVTVLKLSQAAKDFTDLLCKQGRDPAVSMSRADLVTALTEHFKLAKAPTVEVQAATPAPVPAQDPAPVPKGQAKASAVPVIPTQAESAAVAQTTVVPATPPPAARAQPMSRSFAILVLLSSAVELAKDDTDPGADERIKLLALINEKYRKVHGLT